MRAATVLYFIAIAITCLGASPSHAQFPFVQWYFDWTLREEIDYCLDTTEYQTGYIAAVNFNMFFSSVEYRVEYPPIIHRILEQSGASGQLNIGDTASGIASAWPLPMNGFEPVVIMKVIYQWGDCRTCTAAPYYAGQPIMVRGYPTTNRIRFVRFPDNAVFEAYGLTSMICPTIPVEETSWGQVKSLYE